MRASVLKGEVRASVWEGGGRCGKALVSVLEGKAGVEVRAITMEWGEVGAGSRKV